MPKKYNWASFPVNCSYCITKENFEDCCKLYQCFYQAETWKYA